MAKRKFCIGKTESYHNSIIDARKYAIANYFNSKREWITIEDSKGNVIGSIWKVPKNERDRLKFDIRKYLYDSTNPFLWVVEDIKGYSPVKMYPLFKTGRIGKEM